MSFTERLRILIDGDSKGATSALGRFRTSISEADGVGGKLKAGWASATESIKANAVMLAVTAGAALAAFGVKALAAFEGTAKAAIDMGKATGLATEAASRWIAVGDDYGVTADQLATAMGKLGKNMDSDAMKKYGVETRDSAGNAKDANTIFLDVLETLNNTAPAERAKVAAELLGKGWQGIAPLLGKTRDEYVKMLGSVEEGQVISDKEAAKAERMRLAQDRLAEAFGRVKLAVGEYVASFAPVIEVASLATEKLTDLSDALGGVNIAADVANPINALSDGFDAVKDSTVRADVAVGAFDTALSDAQATVEAATVNEKDLAAAVDQSRQAFKDASFEYQLFMDQLSDEEALVSLEQGFADAKKEIEDTGAISDDTRLRLERMFATTLGKDAAGADRAFKIAVDRNDLDLAEQQVDRIVAKAAAGAKFDVTGSWNGTLMSGRGITDALNMWSRNGGPS